MIVVIFEVVPAPGRAQDYLDIAADLRPVLERTDGFISVERFQSLADPARYLSLSFFRDEQAVMSWRKTPDHRGGQSQGRGGIFADYRIRVAQILRDYGLDDRAQAPADSLSAHGHGADLHTPPQGHMPGA